MWGGALENRGGIEAWRRGDISKERVGIRGGLPEEGDLGRGGDWGQKLIQTLEKRRDGMPSKGVNGCRELGKRGDGAVEQGIGS